jgi:hypothetical protein
MATEEASKPLSNMTSTVQHAGIYSLPHTSIENRPRRIRVCDIQPGAFHSPIQCRLRAVDLDVSEGYEALSYVWGNTNNRRPISVESQELRVTKNLDTVLRFLRYADRVRTVWIDAICINQTDIPERNAQVPLMGDIYGRARRTTCWLGLGLERMMAVTAALLDYFRREASDPTRLSAAVAKTMREVDLEALDLGVLRSITDPDQNLCALVSSSIDYLLKGGGQDETPAGENYWQRAWTAQEFALSNEIVLQSGGATLPVGAIKSFSEDIAEIVGFEDGLRSARRLLEVIPTGQRRQRPGLLRALGDNRGRMATDPRDKVYAFLGLSNWSDTSV